MHSIRWRPARRKNATRHDPPISSPKNRLTVRVCQAGEFGLQPCLLKKPIPIMSGSPHVSPTSPMHTRPIIDSIASRSLRQTSMAIALVIVAGVSARGIEPPPVVFDGLGLADFAGDGSVAGALKQVDTRPAEVNELPLTFQGINVSGPSGPHAAPAPLTAELRSRIDTIELAAGLLADPEVIQNGPSRWTGRIGLSRAGATGKESFEVRTMLAPGVEQSLVGVTVGPRMERRLRKGTTFFIDGQAEAQAIHSPDSTWWILPGTSSENYSMLGFTARTGFVR
jgi:hypothetical protein